MSGITSYYAGLAAEDSVARDYSDRGMAMAARRWRGSVGEIDLIARQGSKVIFVEVKKSRTHAEAAAHLTPAQSRRIYATGSEFLAGEPAGQDTDVRFDVALVDEVGRIKVIENAIGF